MSGIITPSPAAAFATTAFLDSEKADIRRMAGYPPYGSSPSGFIGSRFFQSYGVLEFRMVNFAPAEFQNVRFMLAQLYTLESAVWGAGSNLDTDVAAVWTRNKTEVGDRRALFRSVRLDFCALLGVPPGPDLEGGSFNRVI